MKILELAEYSVCRLSVARRIVCLPIRRCSEEEVKATKKTLEKWWWGSRFKKIFARRLLFINDMKEKTVETELQAIALNDTVLVGVPGEVFVKLGLAIKKGSKFKHTFIIGLANSQVPRSIITSQAYDDPLSKLGMHNYEARMTALE